MQGTTQPVAKIPLESTLAGQTYSPELVFSPDGSALYVRQPIELVGPVTWMRWHAPDAAALVMAVMVVWLVWLTRRVMTRRQEPGSVYCRSCNYELTPPIAEEVRSGRAEWLSAEAKCPECGKRTAKPPVVGRLRRWRLLPWAITGGALLMVCALALAFSLTPLRPMQGPTWPIAGIEKVAPGLAFQKQQDHFVPVHKLTRWDLASGKRSGASAVEHAYGMNNGVLSPDGKTWALGCWNSGAEGGTELVLIDTASGGRRALAWGTAPFGVPSVIGFSADSTMVRVQTSVPVEGAGTRVTLDEVEIRTLRRREIVAVDVPTTLTPGAIDATYPYYLTDPAQPGRIVLVVAQHLSKGTGIAVEMTSIEGAQRKAFATTLAARSWLLPYWADKGTPHLASDRIIVVPLFGGTQNAHVDVASGSVSMVAQAPPRVIAADAEGVMPGDVTIPEGAGPLMVSRAGMMSGATASSDGRYIASTVMRQRSGTVPGSRRPQDWVTEVWVWRLRE